MVCDAVEQAAGEPFGSEDLGPFVEWQVAGDRRRGAFVALADGLEKQFGADFSGRNRTKFVDNRQIASGELLLKAAQALLVAGLDQFASMGAFPGEPCQTL